MIFKPLKSLFKLINPSAALLHGQKGGMLKQHSLHSPWHLVKYYSIGGKNSEDFLQGTSTNYVEQMYDAWLHDPSSVHISWQSFFKNVDKNARPGQAFRAPPNLVPSNDGVWSFESIHNTMASSSDSQVILEHLKIQLMVRAYQVRGHQLAQLDPLGILFVHSWT